MSIFLPPRRVIEPDLVTERPSLLFPGRPADARSIQALLADDGVEVHDTIRAQVRDLLRTRSPGWEPDEAESEQAVQDYLAGVDPLDHGVWVHYPWSRRLVHLLPESEFIEVRTDRNHYKITVDEQARLAERTVAVVGLSAGSAVALAIALERGCGELRLADFDEVDLSNLNRLRCGVHEVGLPKTVAAARAISEIDPFLRVVCEPAGVVDETIESFLEGVDLVVEECDSIDVKVKVRMRARQLGLPVLMATSDSGSTDVERFDLEPERPLFHGLVGDIEPTALVGLSTEEKIPFVVGILEVERLSARTRASLFEVDRSIRTWPQLASDVQLGGAVVADLARRILLGEPIASGRTFSRNVARPEVEATEVMAAIAPGVPDPDVPIPVPAHLGAMLEAAVRAPSGGNAQPWWWRAVDDGLEVGVDPSRIGTFLDYDGRASLLAVGAGIENAVLAAHGHGHRVRVDVVGDGVDGSAVARLVLDPADGSDETDEFDRLYQAVPVRATWRGRGDRAALPDGAARRFHDAVGSVPGARLALIEDPTALAEVGEVIGSVERLRLLDPRMHRETMGELRFDRASAEAGRDGISLEELEANAADRTVLGLLRERSVVDLLREWGRGAGLAVPAVRAVAGASALGLITMPTRSRRDHLAGGRAIERAWLTATDLGIGMQPLAPACYLLTRFAEQPESLSSDLAQPLDTLGPRLRAVFGDPDGEGLVMLFRLAVVHPPTTRSLRRPVGSVLRG